VASASIDGRTVMFIGQQKGINTKMRQYRNFGMPNPEGYRKALAPDEAGGEVQQAGGDA
jgi:acetyl-CoA carboxylase alpha subunit